LERGLGLGGGFYLGWAVFEVEDAAAIGEDREGEVGGDGGGGLNGG
jgi:hypothetical protein